VFALLSPKQCPVVRQLPAIMADVFLSCSSEDRPAAQAIARALSARGTSVWWDRSIRAGEDFFDVIESQLDLARCVVVLWSKASVASRWVRAEATEARKQGKLIPLLVGECRPPLVFRQIQVLSIDSAGRGQLPALAGLLQDRATDRAHHDRSAQQQPAEVRQ